MATFTLYFCGTDCWPDESLIDRSNSGGSNPAIYGNIAGYIPAKLYSTHQATRDQLTAVMPGCGAPWYAHWARLWVPCTIHTTGGATRDTATGESMWDLAGHATAKVVGIPSMGRGKHRTGDTDLNTLTRRISTSVSATVNPQNAVKPPSNDCYHWSGDLLEVLLAALQSGYGPRGGITTINLIGHSRGGVAAIMAAHELNYVFPNVPVNIFAIDPVPGSGSLSKEVVHLAAHVNNYVGVYAIDEVSTGFNGVVPWPVHGRRAIDPLLPTDPNARIDVANYHLIYAPGRHGTVAGNAMSDGKDVPRLFNADVGAVGTLISRLASACLRAWGSDTPLTGFGPNDLAWHKARMTSAAATYRNMRKYTYMPFDAHSTQHWWERGITSAEGNNPSAWHYLEDAIGADPLSPRPSKIRSWFRKTRPKPGKVRWQAIQDIPDAVFLLGRWP